MIATDQLPLPHIAPPLAENVPTMSVRKRNGTTEPVDVNKIIRAVERCAHGLPHVDALKVATKTIGGLYDGASTQELDALSIQTAAGLIAEEPEYSRLAGRLLATTVLKEVMNQEIHSFSQSIATGERHGLIGKETADFVRENARKLNLAIDPRRDADFDYFGLRTIYDRYLLRHPLERRVLETPQYFFLRVAAGLSRTPSEAVELYHLMSTHRYLPSTPRCSTRGRPIRKCRPVSFWIPPKTICGRFIKNIWTWRFCPSSREALAWPTTGSVRGGR